MTEVFICGAGSIGNHLAFAAREKGWGVTVFDISDDALSRMKEEIYPSRYGEWDSSIALVREIPIAHFDVAIVGTPPDAHLSLAGDVLTRLSPEVLVIEKPLACPSDRSIEKARELGRECGTHILVGYNHNLTNNTVYAVEKLKSGILGKILAMHVYWQEHWAGIFNAHPWLSGPGDSYLGRWRVGGGACAEHSHGIALWIYFSRILGLGGIKSVQAVMKLVEGQNILYDETTMISLISEKGLIGSVTQDVVTRPPQKILKVQGECGSLEWGATFDGQNDRVALTSQDGVVSERIFPRTRADDFRNEMDYVESLLSTGTCPEDCPIGLKVGIETLRVIEAAHRSNGSRKRILI